VEARRPRAAGGGGDHRLRLVSSRGGAARDLLRQRPRGARPSRGDDSGARPRRRPPGRAGRGAARVTPVVAVFHPRPEPRRARRTPAAVERLLFQRLVDAVVLDARAAPAEALALAARFPRIPMFVFSALRPADGPLVAACHAAGFAGILVEGVDNAIAAEWVAARTAQRARRAALAD